MPYDTRSSKRENPCVLSPVEVREKIKRDSPCSPVERESTVHIDVLQ